MEKTSEQRLADLERVVDHLLRRLEALEATVSSLFEELRDVEEAQDFAR